MKIMYINNNGGGFADFVDVEEGTTVAVFFSQKLPDHSPEDYLIRVNREIAPKQHILQEDDRVTITPTKIEGGNAIEDHSPWHPLFQRQAL